jgi:hypothetical protein
MDLALFESVLQNCDADRSISEKRVLSSIFRDALESKFDTNVELVLSTMLIFQSRGCEYESMQSARSSKSIRLSQILKDVTAYKSVNVIIKETADGLISRADMVHFACDPFLSQNYQPQIIRTVKHLLLDQTYNRLSQTRQLLSCIETSISTLSKNNHVQDETSAKSLDQAHQLSKIFKSSISNSEACFKHFRLQHVFDKPTLIGNSLNSWSRNFIFSKKSAISYDGSFIHLIKFLEGLPYRQTENVISGSDTIELTVDYYLDFTSQFCIRENTTATASNNLNSSDTPDREQIMNSYRLCGAFLAYLVNSSPREDQARYSSAVIFSLASHLHGVLSTVDPTSVSVLKRSDADSAFLHVISLSCGLLFNVLLSCQGASCTTHTRTSTRTRTTHTPSDTDMNTDRDTDIDTDRATGLDTLEARSLHTETDSDVLRTSLCECLELISWTASIAASFSGKQIRHDNIVKEEVAISTLAGEAVEGNIVLDGEFWLGLDILETEKRTDSEPENTISTVQVAFRDFFVIPFFKCRQNDRSSTFETVCSEYLVRGLNYQKSFKTSFPSNSREAFHHQVDDVFYALSSPHRSAIIGWSEHSLNPKVFFSIYVLQCMMMKAFSGLFNSEPQDGYASIPNSTVFNRSDKPYVKQLSRNRMKRKECYTLIENISVRLFPSSPDLYLRILCDAAACAIAIEIQRSRRNGSTNDKNKNSNPTITEKISHIESSLSKTVPDKSEEHSPSQENTVEIIVKIILEIAERSGIPIPMILTAMLNSKSYHPKGISDLFDPQNPGVFSSVTEMTEELGSGITAASVILLNITSDRHGKEVVRC